LRIKYCSFCEKTFHRDKVAAQLMAQLTKDLWEGKEKPEQFVK
jgi:hypothetical protein